MKAPRATREELPIVSITVRDRGLCKPLYGGSSRFMYYGICKRMGCRNCVAVRVPGHKDAEDRELATKGLEVLGWRRSEFDRKWLCDEHA